MKLTCTRTDLVHGLATIGHAVASRSTLPILTNLLIRASANTLTLAATNLEIAVTCTVPADIAEPGETTVPAKLLTDFVNALEMGQIAIRPLLSSAPGFHIAGGASEANIRGMDAGEFPHIPQLTDGTDHLQLDVAQLRGMITQTAFAASTSDSRPIFTAILARILNDQLTLAAADTFRLAVRSAFVANPTGLQMELLIPARTMTELARIMPDSGMVDVFIPTDHKSIIFRTPEATLSSNLIEGTFPNYEAIIPKRTETRVIMPTDKLKAAAKIAGLFAKSGSASNSVTVMVTPGQEVPTSGTVTLMGNTDDLGDSTGSLDATIDGPAVKILFNVKYLAEVLTVIETPEVVLNLTSAQTPGLLVPFGVEDYRYVIMPLYSRG